MAASTTTRRRRAAATAVAATMALVMALALAACSGDDPSADRDEPTPSASVSEEPALPTHTTMGVVSGKLDEPTRERLKRKVSEVVDDWFDAAYVGGEWPRQDFGEPYPHFSSRAARDAARDAGLMSNAPLADRLEAVEATMRRLRIDVLAVQRRAVGITARFVLGMRLSGEVAREDRVAGSLFLTWRDGGWQVFGYDVQRGKA